MSGFRDAISSKTRRISRESAPSSAMTGSPIGESAIKTKAPTVVGSTSSSSSRSSTRPVARPADVSQALDPLASSPGHEEREILAKTIEAEARGEGDLGMLAVGANIANRVAAGRWGSTFTDVIMAPGQYSAWNGRNPGFNDDKVYNGGSGSINMDQLDVSEAAYRAADTILSGNYEDPTGGSLHYYNPSIVEPVWGQARAGGDWKRIGNHIFGTAAGERGVDPDRVASLKTRLASSSGAGGGGGSTRSASASSSPPVRPEGLGDVLRPKARPQVRPQPRPDRGPKTAKVPPSRPEGLVSAPPARPADLLPAPPVRPEGLGAAVAPQSVDLVDPFAPQFSAGLGSAVVGAPQTRRLAFDPRTGAIIRR